MGVYGRCLALVCERRWGVVFHSRRGREGDILVNIRAGRGQNDMRREVEREVEKEVDRERGVKGRERGSTLSKLADK